MERSLVWILPGLLGSELWLFGMRSPGARRIWLDHVNLALCNTSHLIMEGDDPGSIRAGLVMEQYEPLFRHLHIAMPPGWDVREFPYDWRRDARITAADLVETMLSARDGFVELGIRYTEQRIIAHSFGGIIARVAWRLLRERGEGALLRRIVTLATPHRGSHQLGQIWNERQGDWNLLILLKTNVLNIPHPALTPQRELVAASIYDIARSWPAPYQTLPPMPTVAGEDDPHRELMYDAAAWGRSLAHPDQARLDSIRGTWWPYFLAPETTPGPNELVCVACRGTATPVQVVPAPLVGGVRPVRPPSFPTIFNPRADRQSVLPSFRTSEEGDGTVPLSSAVLPGYRSLVTTGDHGSIQSHPVVLREIVGLLLGEIAEPIPPPTVIPFEEHPRRTPRPVEPPLFGAVDC